jgi:hypothetical protein
MPESPTPVRVGAPLTTLRLKLTFVTGSRRINPLLTAPLSGMTRLPPHPLAVHADPMVKHTATPNLFNLLAPNYSAGIKPNI